MASSSLRFSSAASFVAQELITRFTQDLARVSVSRPPSQLTQVGSYLPFNFANSNVRGVFLIFYVGGTIACLPGEEGLEPQPVHSLEELCELNGIDYDEIKRQYPNSEFSWEYIPRPSKPLDSGTMEEPHRVLVGETIGQKIEATIEKYGHVDGIMVVHGTDSGHLTLSRLAEIFSCSPIPFNLCSAQDAPGTYNGDPPRNIMNSLSVLHAGMTGHFLVCNNNLLVPFDATKGTDSGHDIYMPGPYGYGNYAEIDAKGLTLAKRVYAARSRDEAFMPFNDPDLIQHLKNVSGSYSGDFTEVNQGSCYVLETSALTWQVAQEVQKIRHGKADYRYAIVGALGSSNSSDLRKAFLAAGADAGICSVVISDVPGAKSSSPYAAGVQQSQHVTVVQPRTIHDHTQGMFYSSAALTEYVMEAYDVPEDKKAEVRPELFRLMFLRQRGYSDTFIPDANDSSAIIKDADLYLWRRKRVFEARKLAA
jgi:L-asparaginase/Glu-tRNA(Gln) amidotransferase subunit D